MIFGETDESNPFVPVEQMMPFLPFVRCRDVDEAIEKARTQRARLPPHGHHPLEQRAQHDQDGQGAWTRRCSSRTARAWPAWDSAAKDTCSFSIAGPTGEGVTTPLTFTRERRCSMIDDLRILGK